MVIQRSLKPAKSLCPHRTGDACDGCGRRRGVARSSALVIRSIQNGARC